MYSGLVPYAGRAVVSPSRFVGRRGRARARAAIRIAAAALRNKNIRNAAAKTIQRTFRKARATFKKKYIGRRAEVPNTSGGVNSTRVINNNNAVVAFQPDSLKITQLAFTAQSGQDSAFQYRERDKAFFVGFKVCEHFSNTSNNFDVLLHIAIVQAEEQITDEDMKFAFFKAHGNTTAYNFIDLTWSMDQICGVLNRDKFKVLTHFTRRIGPANSYKGIDNVIRWNKFYVIKKRVKFEAPTVTTPTKPFYIVRWWSSIERNRAVSTDNMDWDSKIIVYFRDIYI